MSSETKTQLETVQGSGTGSCCSPEGSCHDGAQDGPRAGVTAVYTVSGMTCGHCESAVSSEISAIDGVISVQAVAARGLVTVVSEAPLAEAAVRDAVDEAGYELTGTA